jgi:hypothetical protein
MNIIAGGQFWLPETPSKKMCGACRTDAGDLLACGHFAQRYTDVDVPQGICARAPGRRAQLGNDATWKVTPVGSLAVASRPTGVFWAGPRRLPPAAAMACNMLSRSSAPKNVLQQEVSPFGGEVFWRRTARSGVPSNRTVV